MAKAARVPWRVRFPREQRERSFCMSLRERTRGSGALREGILLSGAAEAE